MTHLVGCSAVRSRISEALTNNPAKRVPVTITVIATQRLAIVVAKLELANVAVQMALGAVLIDALHTALEDGERALDRVRVDRRVLVIYILAKKKARPLPAGPESLGEDA